MSNFTSQSKTLWIGEIDNWMDENYLQILFNSYGKIYLLFSDVLRIKIIRDKVKRSINGIFY